MPAFLEKALRVSARKAGKKGPAAERYVYGAMNNMGAMRGNKETAKGAAMQRKHDRDQGVEVTAHSYDFRQHLSPGRPRKKK